MQTGDAEAQAAQSTQRSQGKVSSSSDEDICTENQILLLKGGQHSSGSCTVITAHLVEIYCCSM